MYIPKLPRKQIQIYELHLEPKQWRANACHDLCLIRAGSGHALAWGSKKVGQVAVQT